MVTITTADWPPPPYKTTDPNPTTSL